MADRLAPIFFSTVSSHTSSRRDVRRPSADATKGVAEDVGGDVRLGGVSSDRRGKGG